MLMSYLKNLFPIALILSTIQHVSASREVCNVNDNPPVHCISFEQVPVPYDLSVT